MEQQGGTQVPSPLPTRRSVSFDQQQAQPEPSAAEEGIPPGVDAAIGGADDAVETRPRSASYAQRAHVLTDAGLEVTSSRAGETRRTAPLEAAQTFRLDIVTGVWSLHAPLPKLGADGKPRGYASRAAETKTHERPDRQPLNPFDPFDLDNAAMTPPVKYTVMDPRDAEKPLIRVFDNKFPVLSSPDDPVEVAFVDNLFPQVSAVGTHEVMVQHW
jgi:hypothetical protein